jgi:formylglycine-generating enzyme required for sulfatase activity
MVIKKIIFLSFFLFSNTFAFENPKIDFGNFSLNKYEITIQEFKNYAKKNNLVTEQRKQVVDMNGEQVGKKDLVGHIKLHTEKILIVN